MMVLQGGHFMNSVIMIDAGGAPVRTLPKDVQFHPVTDRPLHVDFLRISEHAKVTVGVPIRFIDEESSKGLKRGGVLNAVRHELELVCDAAEIPEADRDQPRRDGHRRFAAHLGGHAARGHRIGDHRPRLHHRHHRRAVRLQDAKPRTPPPAAAPEDGEVPAGRASEGEAEGEAEGGEGVSLRVPPGWPRSSRPDAWRCSASRRTRPRPRIGGNSRPCRSGSASAIPARNMRCTGTMSASWRVDAIAETHGFDPPKKAFSGWAQQGRIGGQRILLLKPATFMNDSGRAVARGDGLLQAASRATSPPSTTSSISPRSR